ncbi:unnamed protein product [Darwinula stevensoni]|uniref:Uncharacterized protein n=1 Tax=Darwinula stevensoni TaxID=69355 RepID=A0A7R8X095_9CRUS|nr:unnamed protein product [Darwinula stevensoni]CAG0881418.1 unnamed protein product [Darwinula stevensoni]
MAVLALLSLGTGVSVSQDDLVAEESVYFPQIVDRSEYGTRLDTFNSLDRTRSRKVRFRITTTTDRTTTTTDRLPVKPHQATSTRPSTSTHAEDLKYLTETYYTKESKGVTEPTRFPVTATSFPTLKNAAKKLAKTTKKKKSRLVTTLA